MENKMFTEAERMEASEMLEQLLKLPESQRLRVGGIIEGMALAQSSPDNKPTGETA